MKVSIDKTIRLHVCYADASADIKIWAQVYDPIKNEPVAEIGQWSLEEFGKIAPTLLRAYWCGRRAERIAKP